SWEKVPHCVKIAGQQCNLSLVFPNLHAYNFIRLRSEEFPWMNQTHNCDPINDRGAIFSAPSISLLVENRSLWVTVLLPCAPSNSCGSEDEEDLEEDCECPLNIFKSLTATVTLFNKHNLSDMKTRSAPVANATPFRVQFGFLSPGETYCAQAYFTLEDVESSSPMSPQQCVQLPGNTGILIITTVFAVLLCLGIMLLLLWRHCSTSEDPLPSSLVIRLREKQ
ncbi:hypothetical protein DNTS_013603, partial [Danionella cerebrum]